MEKEIQITDTEEIKQNLETLNNALGHKDYNLDIVNPKEIKLLQKNARYMPQEMFDNLVNNIANDGALTSLPLCHKDEDDDKYIVLSGNHRVQAAVHAGLQQILIIAIKKKLTREETVSIQL